MAHITGPPPPYTTSSEIGGVGMNRRRRVAALALVFAVNISLIAFAQQAQAATYQIGRAHV